MPSQACSNLPFSISECELCIYVNCSCFPFWETPIHIFLVFCLFPFTISFVLSDFDYSHNPLRNHKSICLIYLLCFLSFTPHISVFNSPSSSAYVLVYAVRLQFNFFSALWGSFCFLPNNLYFLYPLVLLPLLGTNET